MSFRMWGQATRAHWLGSKARRYIARRRVIQLGMRLGAIRLDLGSGGAGRQGTLGVDLHPSAELVWDLTEGLPCDDETVAAIFSDHFFEHLRLPQIVAMLTECQRVLIPGSSLRFTVPHIDPYVQAWQRGDYEFLASKITDVPRGQEALYATPFDRISWLLLRDGEHRALFDRESILHKVRLAGFGHVEVQAFDSTVDISPRFSSVYVVAVK